MDLAKLEILEMQLITYGRLGRGWNKNNILKNPYHFLNTPLS